MAVLGDTETNEFASQIYNFLKSNDFKLANNTPTLGAFSPPPHGINFDPSQLTVGVR